MKRRPRRKRLADYQRLPSSHLIEQDAELAELRQEYAERSPEERRRAADWAYHQSSAGDLFDRALARVGQEPLWQDAWPPGIEALAIDPTFAPAFLTVGSMEYQLGRKSDAIVMVNHSAFVIDLASRLA